jgi:hypothetical protein
MLALTLALSGAMIAGCGGPPAKSANPTRALDERRAVKIIAQAFHDEHDAPVPGQPIKLSEDGTLEVDVIADGHKYGVAYISPNERQQLGKALPPRTAEMGDALQLVHGVGEDTDKTILILRDSDYTYDDQVGTSHEETTITAERKLARDVHDFLVRAHAEHWP